MITVILTDRLRAQLTFEQSLPRFIAMRKLTRDEVTLARLKGLRRYYLPSFSEGESKAFLKEYDALWKGVILSAGRNSLFWRNSVSSKMQEGERSLSYLALILFTLTHQEDSSAIKLLVIYDNLDEKDI